MTKQIQHLRVNIARKAQSLRRASETLTAGASGSPIVVRLQLPPTASRGPATGLDGRQWFARCRIQF